MAEVEVTRDGSVATITLNRPDVLNAFTRSMHEALAGALREAREREVRAVVITGAGRGFCVGQDLNEFRQAARDIEARLRASYHPNILAIRALEKPVIAAVNGAAAGAGLSLACAFEWLTSGRRLTAVEAQAWGLVSEVVEDASLGDRVAELAGTLAVMPTRAIAMTKRLLDGAAERSLEEQLEFEAQLQAAATQTEDFREGVTAFLEKRPPVFAGR